MSITELDARSYIYADGPPDTPTTKVLLQGTQAAVKNRNAKDGPNTMLLARMVIVSVYQLWEDRYRPLIAKARGLATNDLRSNLFGDLRTYRRAIIHANSVAIPEVEANKVLHWCVPGAPINPTTAQMQTLLGLIAAEVEALERGSSAA